MSTMKGEFVEKATTQFILSSIVPLIDRDIADGKVTELEPLLRPMLSYLPLSVFVFRLRFTVGIPMAFVDIALYIVGSMSFYQRVLGKNWSRSTIHYMSNGTKCWHTTPSNVRVI